MRINRQDDVRREELIEFGFREERWKSALCAFQRYFVV